jgi:hypothetical protein
MFKVTMLTFLIPTTTAPAHAIYFASWEYFKKQFGIPTGGADLYPIRSGAAGVLATVGIRWRKNKTVHW